MISGRTKERSYGHPEHSMFVMTPISTKIPEEIHKLTATDNNIANGNPSLEDLWSLETIGINVKGKEEQDELVMESFKSTVSKRNDGRYVVGWPWRKENPNLPDNFELSLGRLKSLMRRFEGKNELPNKYNDIIRDQEIKNIIEKVKEQPSQSETLKHYIPHHAVINPEKATKKIRIIYDALVDLW